MYRGAGMHGGVARTVETDSYNEALPCAKGRQVLEEHFGVLPIIEISDKDYRSFCWPCYALEETGDCQSGS